MENNYIPRTRDDFWLDGVSASSALGIAVDIPPVPPMSVQQYTEYRYGSDTIGFAPDNEFDPLTITVNARVFRRPENFDSTALFAFVQGKKLLKLSRFSGKHFRIRRVLGIQPTQKYKGNEITYKISFVCDPWKYLDDNPEIVVPQDGIVENPGTRYSKPVIRLKTTAAKSWLHVNGGSMTITQPANTVVTVDSNRMLCYKQVNNENISIMQYTEGALPMLSCGTNLIVGTNVSDISVVGNWRCY